jgi:hypothetical protein
MKAVSGLILIMTLAACGGGNNAANTASHDHDNPSGHVAGQFDLGDGWFMQASHEGSVKPGNEASFEILLKKDDKPAEGAQVRVYAADKDGKPLGEKTAAAWNADKKLYTAKIKLPAELPDGTTMTFEADVDVKSFKKSVSVLGHDHN